MMAMSMMDIAGLVVSNTPNSCMLFSGTADTRRIVSMIIIVPKNIECLIYDISIDSMRS